MRLVGGRLSAEIITFQMRPKVNISNILVSFVTDGNIQYELLKVQRIRSREITVSDNHVIATFHFVVEVL